LSSDLVFLLPVVLLAVRDGVDFAFAAAVTILVGFTVGAVALAAALARVMRFGGEFIV
jgi:hypothetical protein